MLMMAVGLSRYIDKARERLDCGLEPIRQEGIKVSIVERQRDDITFLACDIDCESSLSRKSELRERICASVARVLSELILSDVEDDLIARLIKYNYNDFTMGERKVIQEIAKELLHPSSDKDEKGVAREKRRKEEIYSTLYEYLRVSDQVILDGFIRFRLKEYIEELEDAIDVAVDSYMTKKEYGEFVKLLKYFLDIQEPRMEEVQVILGKDGFFKLLDSKNNEVNNEYLEGFILDMVDNDINYDDLLLSALITIAPARIMLHFQNETNIVKTIQDVFAERVVSCRGCAICRAGARPLGR